MLDRNSPVPLYYQLAEILKEKIHSGEIKPGDKLPSESEMVAEYEVGRLTVRGALSQLVNAGYLQKIHGKGTFCKAAQGQAERLNIDVLLDMEDTYFIPHYIKSTSEVLTENDCNFIISDTKDDSLVICELLEEILQKGSSGVILQPSHLAEEPPACLREAFHKLRLAGIPYIMIDSVYEGIDTSYTMLDEYKGGQLAARYLSELGHRQMALVYVDSYKDSILRYNGFINTCAELGLPAPRGISYEKDGEDRLLAACRGGATAVFCYNDDIAVETMRILQNHGWDVPGKVSVLGFDDNYIAATTQPALTTIAHPKQIMGELAARALIELIHKRRPWPYINVFNPHLVERGSCAAPPE